MRKKKKSFARLSHLDARGAARMVDVSAKPVTVRRAVATAQVHVLPQTLSLLVARKIPKGDVFAVARVAGIAAAKRTSELIPLCHPLPIESVQLDIAPQPPDRIDIRATVALRARTGAEMEALTAAAVAALTIYDMCKAVDKGIVLGPIQLEEKSGGKSGTWQRTAASKPRRK